MHTFPSHFIGQIAITNGINNYPIAIQKLISALLSDREVISIMQKQIKNRVIGNLILIAYFKDIESFI